MPFKNNKHMNQIKELLADDTISEIMVNRYDRIFVERKGQLYPASFVFDSQAEVEELAQSIIRMCGKEQTAARNPIIDATLPDGNRVSIILPPIALDGPSISIRKFPKSLLTLNTLVNLEALSPHMARFLRAATEQRVNILIAGGTSSGKTTLLNALSAHINPSQRLVTIEDTPELRIPQQNVVRMVTRDAHQESGREITQRDLLRSALRIRPDRILMGEVRGAEAFDFLQAINTGHEGSLATIHANSPREAFSRLELLISVAHANFQPKHMRQQIASSLDLVIQAVRDESGKRRITNITDIIGLEGEVLTAQDLFTYKADKDGKGDYVWANVSSRNPKIQRAINEANEAK